MCEMVEGVFQYVTLIDNRKPISLSNIGYSIYPNRAMSGEFIDQVRSLFDESYDFKFKLVDDSGRDIQEGAQKEFFDKPATVKGWLSGGMTIGKRFAEQSRVDDNSSYFENHYLGKFEPQVEWVNCSERMPPDDVDIIVGSLINRLFAEPMSGYSLKKWIAIYNHAEDLKWTEFTPGKWEYLNNGK